MATIKQGVIILSSGRHVPLSIDNLIIHSDLQITTGCTSTFLGINKKKIEGETSFEVANPYNLTKDDVNEIADCMMQFWMKLKENIRVHGIYSAKIFEMVVEDASNKIENL